MPWDNVSQGMKAIENAGLSPLRLNPAFFFFSQSHATVAFQDFLSFLLVLSYRDSAKQGTFLVRTTGLEPARQGHQNLNLARLPIPPCPQKTD
jgi:hypothetical protein